MRTLINNVYCINTKSIAYFETDVVNKVLYAHLNSGERLKLFWAPTQNQLLDERIKIREWLNEEDSDIPNNNNLWINAGHVDFDNNFNEDFDKNPYDKQL